MSKSDSTPVRRPRLINFNVFPGDKATPEKIWAELGKLWLRKATGELKPAGPVKSKQPPINVREFVRGLK